MVFLGSFFGFILFLGIAPTANGLPGLQPNAIHLRLPETTLCGSAVPTSIVHSVVYGVGALRSMIFECVAWDIFSE